MARHGEKHLTGDAAVDKDAPLSEVGRARAAALATTLRDAGIDVVYASQFQRTQATAAPVAQQVGGSPVVFAVGEGHGEAMARQIRQAHCGQEVLVVGHSNTLPEILTAFGIQPAPEIPDSAYDRLFVLRWSTTAAPELLTLHFGATTP